MKPRASGEPGLEPGIAGFGDRCSAFGISYRRPGDAGEVVARTSSEQLEFARETALNLQAFCRHQVAKWATYSALRLRFRPIGLLLAFFRGNLGGCPMGPASKNEGVVGHNRRSVSAHVMGQRSRA